MSLDAPPLLPDADTARRWAVEELAKDDYTQGGQSWLDRLIEWFTRTLAGLGDGVGGTLGALGVIVAVIIGLGLVGLVVWLVVGPMRRSRRAAEADGLFEDERGADALEQSARDSASAGDWAGATLDLYRALIRRLAERDVIVLTPGLTAHEAAAQAGSVLPALSLRLNRDADAFDGIRYGHLAASEATYAHTLETLRAASSARARVQVDAP
ncbi:DUF4129 domain-containing protein [Demequina sp.]|uniref:DUF4129 domain-containing protein n=1 Tax=Demequina sp. TaxID=2050685 RepID=UPI0025E4C509|nr:DUF4129 domain-containing protein [Demequina sp.]